MASKRLSWLQMLLSSGLDHPRDGVAAVLEAEVVTTVAAGVGNEGAGIMGKDSWMGVLRLGCKHLGTIQWAMWNLGLSPLLYLCFIFMNFRIIEEHVVPRP